MFGNKAECDMRGEKMSKKVKTALVWDLVVIAVITAIYLLLLHMAGYISHDTLNLALKIILSFVYIIADSIVLFFFLLYWWSDIKWTQVKQWAKRKRQ